MIICSNIKKKYAQDFIFKDFSYKFENCGLYVLYGASGSGKTTLLHMILGIETYDFGTITYDEKTFKARVDFDEIQDDIVYISQDSYFIDYLTILENLKLQTNKNVNEIVKVCKLYKLDKLLNRFPKTLSGGERQRFALMGGVLQNKKIFLLDEPTSSLDKNNKHLIFKILNNLKKNHLIICATHDKDIFKFSPHILDFNDLSKYTNNLGVNNIKSVKRRKKVSFSIKSCLFLFSMIIKQIARTEKRIFMLYLLLFSVVLMLFFSCDNYEKKLFNNIIKKYDVNSANILCSLEQDNYCQDILSKYNASEIVYNYIKNVPTDLSDKEGGIINNNNFSLDVLSLPYQKDNFKLKNQLLYGTYFTKRKQVILGYNMAIKLAEQDNVEIKKLIGKIVKIDLPDGVDTFEIIGIFKQVTKRSSIYFKTLFGQTNFDSRFYLNGEYLNKYLHDDVLGIEETNILRGTALHIYFNSSKQFAQFYDNYINEKYEKTGIRIVNVIDFFPEYINSVELYRVICLITCIIFLIISLFFYLMIHKTKIYYTDHFFSVYQYYGYTNKEIKWASICYFASYLMISFIFAMLIAFILSSVLNFFNDVFCVLIFPPFSINLNWTITLFISLLFITILEGIILDFYRNKEGWFKLLKRKGDLL